MRSFSRTLGWGAAFAVPAALALAQGGELDPLPRTADEADRIAAVLSDTALSQPFAPMPGGEATAVEFGARMPNLPADVDFDAELGKALFDRPWVAAPASTKGADGLGPLYNARTCLACHEGAARAEVASPGLVARLADADGTPHDLLGLQLQTQAAPGRSAEGALAVDWKTSVEALADGTVVALQQPVPRPLQGVAGMDLRLAPQLIGLGLLEAVPEADIRAGADPADRNGDGISGRAAEVFSPLSDGRLLGRFGHKAAHASVMDQTAAAFVVDLGLSSPLAPEPWGDCTALQGDCRAGPHGEDPGLRDGAEVDGETLRLVALYSGTLAPARRIDADAPEVRRGQAVFHDIGCAACHTPAFVTARLPDRPWVSFQLIWPYSNLLLHDMGPGLAAAAGEGDASAAEWRTAPLWGLGAALDEGRGLLHDGRARTAMEAVLWHGGEATGARDRAAALSATDRAALVTFLESL